MSGAPHDDRDVWGLISDVHGNLPALELAIAELKRAGATKLAFLGDYLGRGYSDRCVALIRDHAEIAIVGNRDLDWQDRVSPASKAWVLTLPRTARAGGLLISHGDSRLTPTLSTSQIARDFVRVVPEMERFDASVWAFGHSHHARVWRKAATAAAEYVDKADIPLESDLHYFVNVGTTGLPFPGKGGPSASVVDFRDGHIRQIPLERV